MSHALERRAAVKAAAAISLVVAEVGMEEAGPRLAALPAVRDAPVAGVCRVLFFEALPDVAPRISAKRQAQLEAATRRLDRYSNTLDGQPGAWIEVACSVIAAWAEEGHYQWLSEPPRSLGALALELRREANMRRHGALGFRTERLRPLAAARERAKVKRRRPQERRDQRQFGRLAVRKRRDHG
ncbi:MAG TPA: hypothetical protein VG294_03615 [Solirubrobacteraceae bacterium]|nr:hypothetical protein [Solirubrobacteraceae bacterium]